MSDDGFASVWDAIEDTPADAQTMKLRSTLMMALDRHIRAKEWTDAETARRLGTTEPRVADLLRGKIDVFPLDDLVALLTAAGLHVELRVSDAA